MSQFATTAIEQAMRPKALEVWLYGLLMVTIVSCCSLVGVSIVPLISGSSYKTFITLFTGLAVGSLVGSAIFGLIPQAFSLNLQPNRAYLWKSLVIFLGIYLFYMSERLMRIYFARRTKQKLKMAASRSHNGLDNESNLNMTHLSNEISNESQNPVAGDSHTMSDTRKDEIEKFPQKKVKDIDDDDQHFHHNHTHAQEILSKALTSKVSKKIKGEIAPLAWMIIIGDGLHNFIDGLSIGAAFTERLDLGFSTSLAVIFEEFPHELGDFAVLISSGMTIRQALIFNFLSACTCYIGMIFGIFLGDLTQSASYIFALAGGMFLYISLVDMMGELGEMLEESKGSTRETSKLLLMQNIGILTGISILFGLSWI